jgi:predicted ATP-grasp superfamily ATP-dependent carboligase
MASSEMKGSESSSGAVVVSHKTYDLNALGVVRGLGMKGVKVTWMTPGQSKWFYSKYCKPVNCPDFRLEPNRFVEFLTEFGEKAETTGDALIPTSDASLIPISKNKVLLQKYFRPMVCDWEITEKFIDKSKIYPIAESLGIPIPKTFHPKDEDEAKRVAYEMDYPCLVKPASSHNFSSRFRKKLFRVSTPAELLKTYRFLTSNGFKMMIQEDIRGEDRDLVTFNTVLNENSEPLAAFMHRRIRQNPAGYGVVSLGESTWEPKIIQPCMKLLEAIRFQGIAQVEFKRDPRTGEFKFFEINGRSYLAISLSTACGVNLIYIAHRNIMGQKIPPLTDYSCTYECGVKWLDLPSYIKSVIKLRAAKETSLAQEIRPILTRKITLGAFSRDDTAPFLMELDFLLKNLREIWRTLQSSALRRFSNVAIDRSTLASSLWMTWHLT